jgi:hypothetical protein
MENADKPIRVSLHGGNRSTLRGATHDEIVATIREGVRTPAKRGKWRASVCFEFRGVSPQNGRFYKYKTVEAIFADEPHEIVVVTVKVYYHDAPRSVTQ